MCTRSQLLCILQYCAKHCMRICILYFNFGISFLAGVWFLKRFSARDLTLETCCLLTTIITQAWHTYILICESSNMLTYLLKPATETDLLGLWDD